MGRRWGSFGSHGCPPFERFQRPCRGFWGFVQFFSTGFAKQLLRCYFAAPVATFRSPLSGLRFGCYRQSYIRITEGHGSVGTQTRGTHRRDIRLGRLLFEEIGEGL